MFDLLIPASAIVGVVALLFFIARAWLLGKFLNDVTDSFVEARGHVENLKAFTQRQAAELDEALVRNVELHAENEKLRSQVERVRQQRIRASRAAAAKRMTEARIKREAAQTKTIAALRSAPLRPRDAVIADAGPLDHI